jgi:hypothetical protein
MDTPFAFTKIEAKKCPNSCNVITKIQAMINAIAEFRMIYFVPIDFN